MCKLCHCLVSLLPGGLWAGWLYKFLTQRRGSDMGSTDTFLSQREISESLGNMEGDHSGLSGTEDLTGTWDLHFETRQHIGLPRISWSTCNAEHVIVGGTLGGTNPAVLSIEGMSLFPKTDRSEMRSRDSHRWALLCRLKSLLLHFSQHPVGGAIAQHIMYRRKPAAQNSR